MGHPSVQWRLEEEEIPSSSSSKHCSPSLVNASCKKNPWLGPSCPKHGGDAECLSSVQTAPRCGAQEETWLPVRVSTGQTAHAQVVLSRSAKLTVVVG